MSAVATHDAPRTDSRDADLAAAKRLLYHVRSRLEILTADVIDLMNAIDGKPGTLSELAVKLLDDEDSWRADAGGPWAAIARLKAVAAADPAQAATANT